MQVSGFYINFFFFNKNNSNISNYFQLNVFTPLNENGYNHGLNEITVKYYQPFKIPYGKAIKLWIPDKT